MSNVLCIIAILTLLAMIKTKSKGGLVEWTIILAAFVSLTL